MGYVAADIKAGASFVDVPVSNIRDVVQYLIPVSEKANTSAIENADVELWAVSNIARDKIPATFPALPENGLKALYLFSGDHLRFGGFYRLFAGKTRENMVLRIRFSQDFLPTNSSRIYIWVD